MIRSESSVLTPHQNLQHIRALIQSDLVAVDRIILNELTSDVPLIKDIAEHIIASGGKRLRPLLVLLAAKCCGYAGDSEHHELATVIEFIHTATLLHDDVVDQSELRRGESTANAIWGNEASVLVGDFLYSRAFQILARRNNIPVMTVLANTTNQISEGEIWQLMNRHQPDIDETIYFEVIRRKTAQLFAAASEIGSLIATENQEQRKAMASFGLHFGMAYQIVDDLLDYTSNSDTLGKNIGDDLAEGKITLPLIYAKREAGPKSKRIEMIIQQGGREHLDEVLEIIESTKAINYSLDIAKKQAVIAQNWLSQFPASPFSNALRSLCDFVVARDF